MLWQAADIAENIARSRECGNVLIRVRDGAPGMRLLWSRLAPAHVDSVEVIHCQSPLLSMCCESVASASDDVKTKQTSTSSSDMSFHRPHVNSRENVWLSEWMRRAPVTDQKSFIQYVSAVCPSLLSTQHGQQALLHPPLESLAQWTAVEYSLRRYE